MDFPGLAEPADWLLLDGDRTAVALSVLAVVFATFLGLGYAGVLSVEQVVVRGIAGSLIPGLFTFISIVLAINQLVLSREFGSAGEVRSRVEAVREFRRDVEQLAESGPSPVLPTGFISTVIEMIRAEAEELVESAGTIDDTALSRTVREFGQTVAGEAAAADERLHRENRGRINAVLSVLDYEDSAHLHEARRMRQENDLSEATERALSDLISAFELFDVARTHFRTTYTQRVLARLSRTLLYVGIPSLFAAVALGMLSVPSVGSPWRLPLVSALLTVAFAPLAVLFAYIVRIATVSERTVGVWPFISRPGESRSADELTVGIDRSGDDDWRSGE